MKDMNVTRGHPNRKQHNWLIYKIHNRFLLKHSSLFHGSLYDLGCGESPYRGFFLNYADRYVGVDWAQSQHEIRAEIVADLNLALPIDSDVADTVMALSVMEHLREPQLLLCEAFRILKSGGHLVFEVPWQWWVHEAPYDFFRYTPYALHGMLEKAGFSEIVIEPEAGFFTTAALKWNYFTSRYLMGPKLIRYMVMTCLLPIWYINQSLAPYLDSLDRNWALEAPGYFVTAKKL